MKLLASIALFFSSTVSIKSGGVICTGMHGETPIELSWGTSRVNGSPRLGPYSLTIGSQHFILDEVQPVKVPSGKKYIKIHEVGYWMRSHKLLINLTDREAQRTLVHLEIDTVKPGSSDLKYTGYSFFEVYEPGISRKLRMECSWGG